MLFKLQTEIEIRALDAAGVPFENRPIADLRLKWFVERLADAGIAMIAQLSLAAGLALPIIGGDRTTTAVAAEVLRAA